MITADTMPPEMRLRDRLGGDVWDRSTFNRKRLQRAGVGRGSVRSVSDLARVPPMIPGDVRAASTLLLASAAKAKRKGHDRRYWPLQWIEQGGIPLAYSDEDLDSLAELGRRSLHYAGLGAADVMALLIDAGATREWLQFSSGARRLGLSTVATGSRAAVGAIDLLRPTVLCGGTRELARVLEASTYEQLDRVHTAMVVDDADKELRDRVALLCADRSIALVRSWAPEGALALWTQCRSGEGFHSWPDAEVCEVVDPISGLPTPAGEAGVALWTGIGWYASAVVRLYTGDMVRRLDGPCPTCGRDTPRFVRSRRDLGFAAVLQGMPEVRRWYAETTRSNGDDRLAIYLSLADPSFSFRVLEAIAERIGPADVAIVTDAEVGQRIEAARGEQYSDRRAVPDLD